MERAKIRSFWTKVAVFFLSCNFAMPSGIVYAKPTSTKNDRAEEIAVRARAAHDAGRFEEAAQLYLDAYALSKRPSTLFNAARAKQKAGKFADARELFRIYRTLPGVDARGMEDADMRILECDHEIAVQDAAKVPPPPIVSPPVELAAATTPVQLPITSTEVDARVTITASELGSWQSGVGVGLIVGGTVLMVLGAAKSAEANALATETAQQQENYRLVYGLARKEWGIGLASCVVGAGLTAWGVSKAVTLGPSGALVSFRF